MKGKAKQKKSLPDLKTIGAALCGAAAGLLITTAGQLLTKKAARLVHTLKSPLPLPPLFFFLIGWALFFTVTGIVLGCVIIKKTSGKRLIGLLVLQLVLPLLWPFLTFYVGSLELALLTAVLLLALTCTNGVFLFLRDKTAFYLHMLCPLWVLAATLLNAFFVWYN